MLDKTTSSMVFILSDNRSISWKYFGNLTVQYIIWKTGNIKLKKKIKEQNKIGNKDFFPISSILGIGFKPLVGWWYFAPFRE